ncbi:MAG: hypothetical protein H7Y18_02530 [Clostridiaceae bacterium]|nr:hypothetical protein [Clostridiaceae bacterium]
MVKIVMWVETHNESANRKSLRKRLEDVDKTNPMGYYPMKKSLRQPCNS